MAKENNVFVTTVRFAGMTQAYKVTIEDDRVVVARTGGLPDDEKNWIFDRKTLFPTSLEEKGQKTITYNVNEAAARSIGLEAITAISWTPLPDDNPLKSIIDEVPFHLYGRGGRAFNGVGVIPEALMAIKQVTQDPRFPKKKYKDVVDNIESAFRKLGLEYYLNIGKSGPN